MLLIPAIDLKDGKCVRLRQGRMDDVTIFSENPAEVARKWADEGAERLHVVDLDGALNGTRANAAVIAEIVQACPELPIQVGGGVRDEEAVQAYLNVGVQYVIIGTSAITQPHLVGDLCVEFPKHIIVGLDAKDGKVATDGWSKLSKHDVVDVAQQFEQDGVEAIVYTDISCDGMMKGFNGEATRKLAESITIPVIASGGVSSMDDIRILKEIEEDGVMGAIIGRALYEGSLDFKACIAEVKNGTG